MSIKYICDRCGKEIPENERFNVKVCKEGSPIYYHPQDWGSKDLCKGCADRIIRMAFAKAATVSQEFEDAVTEMVLDSSEPAMKNLDRIREMPAEELAGLMAYGKCRLCAYGSTDTCECECITGISVWLNQEVSE